MSSPAAGFSYHNFSPLEAMTNKAKEKGKEEEGLSIYLSSKGRHEVGDVEFLIVQSLKELAKVRNVTPP